MKAVERAYEALLTVLQYICNLISATDPTDIPSLWSVCHSFLNLN